MMSNPITEPDPTRRQFLAGAAGVALASVASTTSGASSTTAAAAVPRRALGSTGLQSSYMGLGGFSLGSTATLDEAKRIVAEAVDAGLNFFDNAWEYHDGKAEEWMGQCLAALGAGARDKLILMTKVCTHGRDKAVAMQQLEESLKRLKTDHLDIWQIHECVYYNDPEWHFKPDGVVEALEQAKREGKVRFVGFTGHKDPYIHLKMLKTADAHGFKFDTVQMPLNPFDGGSYRSFERDVVPEANRRGMAVLGMKSLMGGGAPTVDMPILPEESLAYAMSLPVGVTIMGVDSLEVLRQDLSVARGFTPLSEQQMQELRNRCAVAAADGHLEMYKSTVKFDGPIGREQHHYPPPAKMPL